MQPLNQNSSNIPAFLSKLWNMVNDPQTDHLISWGASGTSFIIQNQAQFWYELLPVYYKHNNMSSFVRQLNMYGFHKMSSVENNTMDVDKDEIQFFHQYFLRDKPELMKNIKRKVTVAKTQSTATENQPAAFSSEEIVKMLSDVKTLEGRQISVDSQLQSMKQENAVLWRELALLRQKHLKQQQIVNKLIEFLVTIVQPASRMGGLGVRRHYPLMLNENPAKKVKTTPTKPTSTTSEGPTIHELDNSEAVEPQESNATAATEDIRSPPECSAEADEQQLNNDMFSPEFAYKVDELLSDTELQDAAPNLDDATDERVFLNPTTQDTLLSNLMNGGYNINTIRDIKAAAGNIKKETSQANSSEKMTVATRDPRKTLKRLNSLASCANDGCSEDLDNHLESTQNELDQLKDLLNGCTTLDANALLGLFSDEAPPYGLSYQPEEGAKDSDPLMSGSELARYGTSLDFSQLYDDSSDENLQLGLLEAPNLDADGSMTTPQVLIDAPNFNLKK